jgi:hypothetical protein
MAKFCSLNGKEFLELKIEPRKWLVEGIIKEKDSVILVGNEKSGKSLFIFQLICSLTSGQPFIDTYAVTKPTKVAYFQLEGELEDSQDRMIRLSHTLELHPDLFHIYFYGPLELQSEERMEAVRETIIKNGKPDILIIDPVYFAFSGSLNNDDIVRNFIGNIRKLKEQLDCAVILVHHTHKQRWATDGFQIDEGDDAIFGSKFLKAWADHILLFMYDAKKNIRTLSCTTQRSGDIIKKCELTLIEPDPLYFEPLDKNPTSEILISNLLHSEKNRDGMLKDDICMALSIPANTFYASTKKLFSQKVIIKSKSRPTVYLYNWENDNE